jgi:hypothetical protein
MGISLVAQHARHDDGERWKRDDGERSAGHRAHTTPPPGKQAPSDQNPTTPRRRPLPPPCAGLPPSPRDAAPHVRRGLRSRSAAKHVDAAPPAPPRAKDVDAEPADPALWFRGSQQPCLAVGVRGRPVSDAFGLRLMNYIRPDEFAFSHVRLTMQGLLPGCVRM